MTGRRDGVKQVVKSQAVVLLMRRRREDAASADHLCLHILTPSHWSSHRHHEPPDWPIDSRFSSREAAAGLSAV